MERVKKATDTYRDATGRLRDANGKFVSSGDRTRGKLLDIDKAAQKAGKSLGGLAKTGASAFGSLAKSAAKFGALAGVGFAAYAGYSSVKKAMSFEAQMSSIQALTGATKEQMQQMQLLALQQGALTKYSALESAKAIEELLKAGMTTAQVQADGLNAALNLATAGGLELTEAAETMATSLNAFKKDGLTAAQTADILAGTANAAATDIRGIGYGIASAGGVADMAGVSFRDLNAAIGLMSNDGLKNGSDAGTSFKSMLMYLQPQTEKAAELFERLGIGVGKANKFFENGKLKSLDQVAEILQKITKNMSDQERVATFLDLFGTDGVKAATTLYKAGSKGVKEFYRNMSTTTALEVARKKMDNAAGAVEQFQGAIETLQISALLPTMPLISDFANAAAEMVIQYTPQITAAFERMSAKIKKYIASHYTNNPEFQKLTTLESKIKFVFEDIMTTFNAWLGGGGREKIEKIAASVIKFLAGALKASDPLMQAAIKIGVSVGEGILKGILSVDTLKTLMGGKGADFYKGIVSEGGTLKESQPYQVKPETLDWVLNPLSSKSYSGGNIAKDNPFPQFPGHAAGLNRVPYNGYPARLHRDEMVLTRTEAQSYRESGGNGGGSARPIVINLNGVTIREDADIDRLAAKLAHVLAQ
ncbi:TP901 family phage tail tape measure protein [Fontibacillus phaseoli]|uniref:TP901 family phage tail tape measure protein n=1 Tax=Fontibacillus phaseoli TaxID=1416533 RepID=A0A369BNJ3_9BACL|nr:phage tail tape measure protein [Fontibacillus phaseoli]RCX22961.1 TP901 family phage tail tape measure protein [Fontibacillus phaseoli]